MQPVHGGQKRKLTQGIGNVCNKMIKSGEVGGGEDWVRVEVGGGGWGLEGVLSPHVEI